MINDVPDNANIIEQETLHEGDINAAFIVRGRRHLA